MVVIKNLHKVRKTFALSQQFDDLTFFNFVSLSLILFFSSRKSFHRHRHTTKMHFSFCSKSLFPPRDENYEKWRGNSHLAHSLTQVVEPFHHGSLDAILVALVKGSILGTALAT